MRTANLLLFSILILISACAPVYAPPDPPQVLLIQLSPALSWMTSSMNTCALRSGTLGLVIDETRIDRINPEALIIHVGDIELPNATVYEISRSELKFIVNPLNPLCSIEFPALISFFDGTITSWDQLGVEAGAIKLWQYPDSGGIRRLASEGLGISIPLNIPIGIAPNPIAMRELVAREPNALGYLLDRFMDQTVKSLEISGADRDQFTVPVLASTTRSLSTDEYAWLACVSLEITACNEYLLSEAPGFHWELLDKVAQNLQI